MSKREKILEKLKDQEYIDKIMSDHQVTELIEFSLVKHGKPQPYARPRAGRGVFYNPLSKMMNEDRKMFKDQLDIKTRERLEKLFSNEKAIFYVTMTFDFYIETQKGSSIKDSVLKELKVIRPDKRPDIDNYDKYILDVLHEICYADDKNVISVRSDKFYALDPRTEINVKIEIIED